MSSDDEIRLAVDPANYCPWRLTRTPTKNGGILDYYGPPVEMQIAGRWLHAKNFDVSSAGDMVVVTLRRLSWIDAPTIDENGDPIPGRSSGPVDFAKHLRF